MEAEQGVWMTTDGLYHRGSPKRAVPNGGSPKRAVHSGGSPKRAVSNGGSPRRSISDRERVQQNQYRHQLRGNHNYSNNNEVSLPPATDQVFLSRSLTQHQPEKRSPPDNSSERCKCCPYGYHIDLDFMRICDEISSGVNLRETRKPANRGRRKFGSMPNDFIAPPVPTRSSSMHMLDRTGRYERQAEEQDGEEVLSRTPVPGDDIFHKENQEFWDIYNQFDEHLRTTSGKSLSKPNRNRLPSDTQSLPPDTADVSLSDVDSICSEIVPSSSHQTLASQTAMNSLRNTQGHRREYRRQEPMRVNLRDMANLSSSNTSISSTSSSNRFSPLPFGGVYSSLPNVNINSASSSGRSTPSAMGSSEDLTRVRQKMASALVRLRQLEGQVRTIPTLHVKINVLKEEKRLLKMQIHKREQMEQSRDAEMQRDSLDLQRLEDGLIARESDLRKSEGALGHREFDLDEREGDVQKREEALKRLESECEQREAGLDGRESDLGRRQFQHFREEQQSELLLSASSGGVSNGNHRPNTLEELAEKLNSLKKVPPPVAPKPQGKGPPRRAVVQPYIHTRSVGVHVNTIECICKDSPPPVKSRWRMSGPQPYPGSAPQPYQGINVTMWKPNSLPGPPHEQSTQTEIDHPSAPLKLASTTQTIKTQTAEWGVNPHVKFSEFSTQTVPEPESPPVQTECLETQTKIPTRDSSVDAIEPKLTCSIATYTAPIVREVGTSVGHPERGLLQSRGVVTDVCQRRHFGVNTEEGVSSKLWAIEPKVTCNKETSTVLDVRDRSTSVEQPPQEREVYSRGMVTDVVQKRHMGVSTEAVGTADIVPSVASEVTAVIDASEGVMEFGAEVDMEDASTETEVDIRRRIGAVRDVSVEALCETQSIGVSAGVLMGDQSSLASAELRDFGCGPSEPVVAEVCTITDTLDMIDTETYMDETYFRTYSTNTEPLVTSHIACEASVVTKEQWSQMEEETNVKEVSQVGIQAVVARDCTDTGSGDKDVNILVCDKCTNVKHCEAAVSTSDHELVRTGGISTNSLFIEEAQVGQKCNACRNRIDQDGRLNLVSVGVGGDTTLEKLHFTEISPSHVSRTEHSPTNRSFPATNPNERRRPRSNSSPALPTGGFFSDIQPLSQPSATKLSFPDPPDLSHFKWSSPTGHTNEEQRGGVSSGEGDGSSNRPASEGEDTTLEESTESIFRAEEVVFRRSQDGATKEGMDSAALVTVATPLCAIDEERPMAIAFSNPYFLSAGQSPLDPPADGIDGIRYNRQTSQESSSAPQSTSQSLSSLVTSSDEEEDSEASYSSDDSASFSTTTEGSYDGHTGRVHIKRRRKVTPTTKGKQFVYPQKVPLSPLSFQACQVIEKHVTQPQPEKQDKEYVASLSNILREWFEISSQENSEVEHVQGYLMSLADVSKQVLKKIINMADGNGNTALHYSISHGNFDIVDALLESGVCEVNEPNKAGATAIMLTALAGILEEDWTIVEKLVKTGEVNIRSTQAGQTALMLAVSRGKVQMVRLLLEAGADVNVQDEDGSTALMCASEHGHLDIVKLLIAQPGCDISIDDNDGCNAFSIAMENGHKAIGVLLYAHMNFGKSSSKKRVSAGSPSGRLTRNPLFKSMHSLASRSPTQEAPPVADLKQSSRSRSLSPNSRKSLLHSSRSKLPSPARGAERGAEKGGKKTPTSGGGGGSGNTTATRGRGSTPKSKGNFARNTSLRKSLPARSRHSDDGGIVKALRKARDPQSKVKSV